jgi:hypothetical protein
MKYTKQAQYSILVKQANKLHNSVHGCNVNKSDQKTVRDFAEAQSKLQDCDCNVYFHQIPIV